jgi:uncharacterized protein with PQ loop repeat
MVQGFAVRKDSQPSTGVEKILPFLSTATMLMTLPQIYTIWFEHRVDGVSLLSWGTYLVAACFWFVHGLQKKDKAIWVACVGWVLLDAAVVIGVLVYR